MSALSKDEAEMNWEIDYLNRLEKKRAEHTPDYLKLAQYADQYLFVVDNLKKAQTKHWFIKDVATLKCNAFTDDKFVSYNYNLGQETFPVPMEYTGEKVGHLTPTPSIFSGELFLVSDSKVIESIDRLRGNGVRFVRKRVAISIPYRKEKWIKDINKIPPELIPITPGRATTGWYTHHMKAWMYVGIKEHWEPLLDGGYYFSPTQLVRPNSEWTDSYYLFNNRNNV